MKQENPYKTDPGYVAARHCHDGGFVVVYDRLKGGEWISGGDTRWVAVKYSNHNSNQGVTNFKTRAAALILMEATSIGNDVDWYDRYDGWRC